jgi:hypothetical protein
MGTIIVMMISRTSFESSELGLIGDLELRLVRKVCQQTG